MVRIKNEKLRAALSEEIRDQRGYARERIKGLKERMPKLDSSAEKIESLSLDWFASVNMIFVRVEGKTKAEFSAAVERVATALGESPDVTVRPNEYMADFKESLVHVYLSGAEDCKVIEVEETITRKVLKPHPSCKAALAKLEEIA